MNTFSAAQEKIAVPVDAVNNAESKAAVRLVKQLSRAFNIVMYIITVFPSAYIFNHFEAPQAARTEPSCSREGTRVLFSP